MSPFLRGSLKAYAPGRPRGWRPRATWWPQEVGSAAEIAKSGILLWETEARSGCGGDWDLPIGPRPYSNPILQIGKLRRREGEQNRVRTLSNGGLQDLRSQESEFLYRHQWPEA